MSDLPIEKKVNYYRKYCSVLSTVIGVVDVMLGLVLLFIPVYYDYEVWVFLGLSATLIAILFALRWCKCCKEPSEDERELKEYGTINEEININIS